MRQGRTQQREVTGRAQETDAVEVGRGGGMSRQGKTAAVLQLLRGEDLETVSHSLGVTAATLTAWRDAFLTAGEAALASRQATARNWRASASRPNLAKS